MGVQRDGTTPRTGPAQHQREILRTIVAGKNPRQGLEAGHDLSSPDHAQHMRGSGSAEKPPSLVMPRPFFRLAPR